MKKSLAAIFGNLLEHYDSAIFGILSPFIAPIFFCDTDPVIALFWTYLMLPLGLLAKPLGALFFGQMGDCRGRSHALSISLIGMALATVLIGCLPTYQKVGVLSPLLLLVCRLLQGFFAAGEVTGGAIYLLENGPEEKSDFLSGLYDSSAIVGIFVASLIVTLFVRRGLITTHWRVIFWLGGIAGVVGFFLRRRIFYEGKEKLQKTPPLWQTLCTYRMTFLRLMIIAGFSQACYIFPFTLLTGFVPLVSNLTKSRLIEMNTGLLFFDLVLLPCFGWLSMRVGRDLVMKAAVIFLLIAVPAGFWICDLSSLWQVMALRVALVIGGVAYAASYYAYAVAAIPSEARYTVVAVASALGSLLFGKPTAALSVAFYTMTHSIFIASLYFVVLAAAALVTLSFTPAQEFADA